MNLFLLVSVQTLTPFLSFIISLLSVHLYIQQLFPVLISERSQDDRLRYGSNKRHWRGG